ncbi:hypothetical protein TIFTF001_025102 [Ficus carica]|uniref:Uncharacterized protein n=1 Tax=Ficus carica TaxID=3494 RepID=A0AA88ANN4_FICCA|nr:hypothetical protein TIFTF001_025102 [Ficus carica]
MELAISNSSLRVPKIIPRLSSKASSNKNRVIPIKPITKGINKISSNFPSKCSTNNNLILPVGLYRENKFSNSSLYGQDRRDTVRVCAQVQSGDSHSTLTKVLRFGSACCKLARVYVIIPIIVSTICLFARVFLENPTLFQVSLLFKAFPGLIAVVFANAYHNGINGIYDADIDRINKPYLPIPSGEISLKQAWFLMIFYVVAGLLILSSMNANLITTSIYSLGLLLATMYSVPPFRLKRYSLATSLVNSAMAGILHNVGILYATRASLGLPFQWSPPYIFITTFVTIFFLVVTNIKDLTDVDGDIKHNIRTFTAIYGPRKITLFCTGILLLNYIAPMVVAICKPQTFNPFVMVPAHTILSLWLLFEVKKLDKANYAKEKSANFFQLLWKLVGLEYLLFPFI